MDGGVASGLAIFAVVGMGESIAYSAMASAYDRYRQEHLMTASLMAGATGELVSRAETPPLARAALHSLTSRQFGRCSFAHEPHLYLSNTLD